LPQTTIYNSVQQFGEAVQPTFGQKCADRNGRDQSSSYVQKPGQLAGIIKLVTGWHGIGQTVRPFSLSLRLLLICML
jgi:hypothetical protein